MRPEQLRDRSAQSGIALLLTIMAMLLLSVLAAAIVLLTSTEALIASTFRSGREAFYAAEAAGEWSLAELAALRDDWTGVVNGLRGSSFVDGAPVGTRMLAGGSIVDLTGIAAANPGWRLFSYGPFETLVRAPGVARFYIVTLVSPDPASLDALSVRALALGPRGARRTVELQLLRSARGVHVVSWRERP
jgi:hypothetical protein